MKLFQYVKQYNHAVGIRPSESNPLNFRIVCLSFTGIALSASTICSMIFQANTIMDYANCFTVIVTAPTILINYWVMIARRMEFFIFVTEFEEFLQMSKLDKLQFFIVNI